MCIGVCVCVHARQNSNLVFATRAACVAIPLHPLHCTKGPPAPRPFPPFNPHTRHAHTQNQATGCAEHVTLTLPLDLALNTDMVQRLRSLVARCVCVCVCVSMCVLVCVCLCVCGYLLYVHVCTYGVLLSAWVYNPAWVLHVTKPQ